MTHPHDALFRYTFSQPEYAAQLIRGNLPGAIAERIDWASIKDVSGSFIDKESAWRHTDLLFQASLSGRDAYVYLLFEHQSTSEPLMALRMVGYLVRIWEKIVKDKPNAKAIPAVIPLVLYHGKEGWHAAKSFGDLIDIDEQTKRAMGALIPDFRYILDDLSVTVHASVKPTAKSPAKSASPGGTTRRVLPVHNESDRGRKPI